METKVQVPAGVTGNYHEGCRECKAGYYQAKYTLLGFRCLEHGVMEYGPQAATVSLSRQRDALLKACEAALSYVEDHYSGGYELHKTLTEELEVAIQLAREGQDGR